jgi:cephalosporin hydroxylase
MALTGMVWKTTNFSGTTWLGHPIWQNPLDAWALQEAISGDGVDLVIECGTNRGGSALYMANLFDLMGRGHVITLDITSLHELSHPRIDFLIGSDVEDDVVDQVRQRVEQLQPKQTMVLLDSDHTGPHVLKQLQKYADFVPVGGYMYVQDGCIDEIPAMRADRPGPLWATRKFVESDSRFVIDAERSNRYLFSHSPSGWLRRVR